MLQGLQPPPIPSLQQAMYTQGVYQGVSTTDMGAIWVLVPPHPTQAVWSERIPGSIRMYFRTM